MRDVLLSYETKKTPCAMLLNDEALNLSMNVIKALSKTWGLSVKKFFLVLNFFSNVYS